jgi:hypothetical protein
VLGETHRLLQKHFGSCCLKLMRIKLSCEHFATWCGLRTWVAVITCSRSAVIAIPAVYSSSVSKSSISKEVEDLEDEEPESEDVELEDEDELEDVFDITGD